jgi:ubiquinone/menaquinone biosynthesis C-methylase UbiE
MNESYNLAFKEIANTLVGGGHCLDCGANSGNSFNRICKSIAFDKSRYHGIEWNKAAVDQAQLEGLNMIQGDLNRKLPFEDGQFRCVFGLSLLEHLLNGCAYMKECHRVLENGGKLILLTPNISTFFTIALLLVGKMPSSGPYPDSNALLAKEQIFKVSNDNLIHDTESETPVHRHLVVFSYRVLRQYLSMIGFSEVQGYGFGLYPFPLFMQPVLERIDPYHCHQMVFVARK